MYLICYINDVCVYSNTVKDTICLAAEFIVILFLSYEWCVYSSTEKDTICFLTFYMNGVCIVIL